jgi:hypothetical protein
MKDKAKHFFINMLSDVDGGVSSKRIITLLFSTALLITWGYNLWWGATPAEFIFDGMMYIIGIGLGSTAVEHFSKKNKNLD